MFEFPITPRTDFDYRLLQSYLELRAQLAQKLNRDAYKPSFTEVEEESEKEPQESPKEEPNKSKASKNPPAFNKIGIEPTFMPRFTIHPVLAELDSYDLWDDVSSLIGSKIRRDYSPWRHPWKKSAHNDASSLEIPSPTYESRDEMLKDFRSLLDSLAEFDFYPSSVICELTEGGCHTNYDLVSNFDSEDERKRFSKNLFAFVKNHPEIVWAFLSPYDNNSSHVKDVKWREDSHGGCDLSKGEFMTVRDDYIPFRESSANILYQYVELRFFVMPKTVEELELHLDFSRALLKYVATLDHVEVNEKTYYGQDVKKLSKNLTNVCNLIGIDPKRLKKHGKFDAIERRVEANKNKKDEFHYRKNMV